MRLALFDIDGTLTFSHREYDRWFTEAVRTVLGIPEFSVDWSAYTDVTDTGLVREIARGAGRAAVDGDIAAVYEAYHGALADVPVTPLPGARDVLRRVAAEPGWRVAIATGNWARAGRHKLARAGVEHDGVPLGGADDAPRRADILRAAIAKAGGHFERVVYLGDAVWDVATTRALEIPFVGLTPEHENGWPYDGVSHTLDGYEDHAVLMEALERAAPPE